MRLFDLFFLKSANLICLSTDISKHFRESLGIRDNESRLYISIVESKQRNPYSDFAYYSNRFLIASPIEKHYSTVRFIQPERCFMVAVLSGLGKSAGNDRS